MAPFLYAFISLMFNAEDPRAIEDRIRAEEPEVQAQRIKPVRAWFLASWALLLLSVIAHALIR